MTTRRTFTPLTRVLRWLRGPWVAPDPAPDLSRLDRADGLTSAGGLRRCPLCPPDTRQDRADLHATLRAEGTRYDAEWPDVLAAEAPGGDLAAMAAPLPGMARDELGVYAEPVEVHITAEWTEFRDTMARLARAACVDMAEWSAPSVPADPPRPCGRHRQTDPLDLILADLRDLGGQS